MITEKDVTFAFENEFDGIEKGVLVETILEIRAKVQEKDELIFAYDATRSPVIDKTILDLRAELDEKNKEMVRLESIRRKQAKNLSDYRRQA